MGDVYTKLQKIQAELKVPKSKYSDYGGYSYRSLEDIYEAVKPLLNEEGLLLTLEDKIVMIGNRIYVKATAILRDTKDDRTIETAAYAREEESKKKMDVAQITGSASSYAKKYALNNLFLLDDSKDADTDEYKENETVSMAEARSLCGLMRKKGMTEQEITEWGNNMGLKSFYEITRRQYAEAMKELGLK
jgi:hypothetical protein